MDKKKIGKWLYWFLFAACVIIVYKTLDSFTDILTWVKGLFEILMPFIIGILVAYLFYIPARKVEKWYIKANNKFIARKARGLSVLTVYAIAVILIILAMNFVIPTITQSVMDLVNNLPSYVKSMSENLENLPADSFWNKIDIKGILQEVQNIDLKPFFNMESVIQYAKGMMGLANGIFDFFISVVVSIYVLLERTEILNFFKKLGSAIFQNKTYKALGRYFYKGNEIFFRFVSSQLLDAIVVGILTSIAMAMLNVKYAVLLGFLIGLSNMIPYIGAIVGVAISIIITIFTGGIGQAIWMGLLVIILQQVDANVINPKITGTSLKLSPILVIFSVTMGGAYFGILGMFLAVPIISLLKVGVLEYIDYRKEKQKEEALVNE